MSKFLRFRHWSVVTVLIAVLSLAACQQATFDPAGGGSYNAARSAQDVGIPPTQWTAFTPLPFSGATYSDVESVSGLATDGTVLVAAAYDGENHIAYVSTYEEGVWSEPEDLTPLYLTIKPGAAHYLNNTYFLVTGASTSTTGVYSTDGSAWTTTGNIGFGTKAALYGARYYVVAGQNGQAAYAQQLSGPFSTIPQSITGWSGTGSAAYINTGVYAGGYYVFGGGSGRIAYTQNITSTVAWPKAAGTTSTNYPFDIDAFVNVMAYDGTTIVAVGEDAKGAGIIAYSINNGLNWQAATTPVQSPILTDGIYALTYGAYLVNDTDPYFVAVNDSGDAVYSATGASWTDALISVSFSDGVNAAVFYTPTNTFFAGGSDSSAVLMAESN
jgi:hypothetical protein